MKGPASPMAHLSANRSLLSSSRPTIEGHALLFTSTFIDHNSQRLECLDLMKFASFWGSLIAVASLLGSTRRPRFTSNLGAPDETCPHCFAIRLPYQSNQAG